MEELRRLQAERDARLKTEMPIALNHYRFHLMQDLPFEPSDHGFVFSLPEIDDALSRELREKRVKVAVDCDFDLAKFQKHYPPKVA